MKIGAALAVVLLAAGLAVGCSRDTGGEPAAAPTSTTQRTHPVLDGVYRLDVDRERQLDNGSPDPDEPFWLLYAFRSNCLGDTCIATARQLQPDDPATALGEQSAVFDLIDGAWVRTDMVRLGCGDGEVAVGEVWSLQPEADGTLTGTRRLGFNTVECSDVYEQPVTATRVGDVNPAAAPVDPASVAPLKPSAGAGFTGRYDRTRVLAGGQQSKDQVAVTTSCVRNSEQCVAFQSRSREDGSPDVWALVLADDRWTTAARIDTECPGGGSAGGAETHIEYTMPDRPTNPIPRLLGVQRDVFTEGCTGTRQADIVLQRAGD